MKSQRHPYDKLEIITDVFGERFYVREELYDKKFKLRMHSGRPVAKIQTSDRFILTAELKALILSTLDIPSKEFNGVLKVGTMNKLRRLFQDNPFKSYECWVNSKRANKPRFITFNDSQENPQILIDALGYRYVLLSALRTGEGLILPRGVLEVDFLNKKKTTSIKYILTHEVAKHLKEIRFNKNKKNSAISNGVFYSLCEELGRSACQSRKVLDERNAFFVQHLDALISLTAEEFLLQYADMNLPKGTIKHLKMKIALILKELQNPSSTLIPALLEHWKQPNAETCEKVDVVYGRNSSNIRRAFLLLKKAKRI